MVADTALRGGITWGGVAVRINPALSSKSLNLARTQFPNLQNGIINSVAGAS